MASAATTPKITTPEQQIRSLRLVQTIAYFTAFTALGMSVSSIGPTLGTLAGHTGSTLAQVSVLFTARSFGYMIGSLAGGRLYDRVKGNPIVGIGFIVMAGMLAITPVISQLWLLSLVLIVLSVADGIIDVGCNALLVWAHLDNNNIGPVMNALHFFFGIGAFITPILAAQVLATTGDVHWVYWILALVVLVPAILQLRTPSPSHVAQATTQQPRPRADMRFVLLIGVFFFAIVGMEATFAGWIASYAVAVGFGNLAQAAVLTSVFWGGFTLARLLSIPLATRVSPRAMLWVHLLGCAVFAALMVVFGASDIVMWVGTFSIGFCVAPLFPTMISFAETRMAITGRVTSVFLAASSIGGMTLPWLIGQVFVSVGPITLVWALFAFSILAIAVILVVQRPHTSN